MKAWERETDPSVGVSLLTEIYQTTCVLIQLETQIGLYGRPLDPSRPGFVFPVYVAFLLAPTIKSSFAVVQIVFTIVALALTIGSVLLWLHVLRVKWTRSVVFLTVLLTPSSFPALQGLFVEDLTLVVAAVTSAFLAASGDTLFPLPSGSVTRHRGWVAAMVLPFTAPLGAARRQAAFFALADNSELSLVPLHAAGYDFQTPLQ